MALLGKLAGLPTDAGQFNAMSGILVPTLHVMSGVCAFAALHHSLAVMRRRVNRIHLLFAALSLSITALILAKAGAYQAQTVQELVALRKWEVSAVCLFFALFPGSLPNTRGSGRANFWLGWLPSGPCCSRSIWASPTASSMSICPA